jgi:ubiquinone biosynthesis protein UbiJ
MTASPPPFFALPVLPSPLAALPAALNHILAREPWARQQLVEHAGKTLRLTLAPFALSLTLDTEGLVRLAESDAVPNVSIELPPGSLGAIFVQGPNSALRQVKLEGDAEFAQAVSLVAQNVRWEFEEDLSRVVGDIAARRLTRTAQEAARQVRLGAARAGENLAEYLLEEDPQLVRPRQVRALADAVRTLRDDLARLEKRIERQGRT